MWLFAFLVGSVAGNYPVFDATTQMKNLLVPADLPVGSIIYRLRATDADRDHPLTFDATDYGSYVIRIENLPCDRNVTHCDANVYLERVLVPGQVFKFRLTVKDTKGLTTTLPVSIHATNGRTDVTAIFPHIPGLIVVPENTKVGTELEYVVVRKNLESKKPAMLELWGTTEFSFRQSQPSKDTTTGIILLSQPLDFERRTMYKLWVFATDMAVEVGRDSRNIAGFELVIVVQDVQDTPPIFQQHQNPVTKLRSSLKEGDFVTRVTAIDGDRGTPRPIKYGLVSEGSPFTVFFNIDRKTGNIANFVSGKRDIFLARPLKELSVIARSHQPILLSIIAEEEATNPKEPPPLSSIMTIALLLGEAGNTPPYFDNPSYVCRLDENSLQGTALVFSEAYSTQVHDDDMGKQGVFSLSLEGQNGTFEITPGVAERHANFMIRVRNSALLDYEQRRSIQFMIVAKELGSETKPFSSNASVLVYLNDVNDNPPQFLSSRYEAQIPENITANTKVLQVNATDKDEGAFGSVRYTGILGYKNTSLILDRLTGEVKISSDNHGFDREEAPEFHFFIEARDMEGVGLRTTVPFILRVIDINDETPTFEKNPTQFILTPDLQNFSERAFVKAIDKDAESPNNVVKYEIISGNYENKFALDPDTGELTVRNPSNDLSRLRRRLKRQANPVKPTVQVLTVRAYDLGVPHRSSTSQIRVYPADSGARTMSFILPGISLDWRATEEFLAELTGARVSIHNMQPYYNPPGNRVNSLPQNVPPPNADKSVVRATVSYYPNAVVDVSHLQDRFAVNKTAVVVNQTVAGNLISTGYDFSSGERGGERAARLVLQPRAGAAERAGPGVHPGDDDRASGRDETRLSGPDEADADVGRPRARGWERDLRAGAPPARRADLPGGPGRARVPRAGPGAAPEPPQPPQPPLPARAGAGLLPAPRGATPPTPRSSAAPTSPSSTGTPSRSKGPTRGRTTPSTYTVFGALVKSLFEAVLSSTLETSVRQLAMRGFSAQTRVPVWREYGQIASWSVRNGSVRQGGGGEHQERGGYEESTSEPLSRLEKASHEEMFIKEGNAEILRLRTREHGEQQQRAQSLEAAPSHLSKEADSLTTGEELGKKMIMQRFIDGEGNEEQVSSINENLLSNNLLLTRYFIEEQQRSHRNRQAIDTQSLPGKPRSQRSGNYIDGVSRQSHNSFAASKISASVKHTAVDGDPDGLQPGDADGRIVGSAAEAEGEERLRGQQRQRRGSPGIGGVGGGGVRRKARLISILINSGGNGKGQANHNHNRPIKSPIIEESESSPESCANKHARKHKALHSSSSRSLTDLINSQRFREDTLLRGSERDLRSRVAKARAKELEESGLKKAQSCAEIHPEVLEKQLRTQDYIPKSLKARFLSRNRNCLETTGVDGKLRLKEKAQKEGADWQATGKRKDEQKAKVGATPVRSRSQLLKRIRGRDRFRDRHGEPLEGPAEHRPQTPGVAGEEECVHYRLRRRRDAANTAGQQ
ncbi:unnamed protein product [Bemisia tabaci]|uniref:Cadherin domain-containing protein n=1 Tax=Bemisia tabaci TaxID=7038 RepID=A0AAI8UPH9_BEMTA|nr:unnamed protein product [Bemisia tabaci]